MTLPANITREDLLALDVEQLAAIHWRLRWTATARPKQIPPPGLGWSVWGAMAGRGFGKTRTGAEWLGWEAYNDLECLPSCVVAPTAGDLERVCFEGPAGLLKCVPPELVFKYVKSPQHTLILKRKDDPTKPGSVIMGYSAEEPDRLRGPQHARAWCDELAAWQYGEDAWDMLQMGMRLGPNPQTIFTTTPKPVEIVRRLDKETRAKNSRTIIVSGSTYENRANLPDAFFDQLKKYEGTRLGRQELEGELVDLEEAGIIKRSWIRLWPADKPLPRLEYVLVSLDTAFTEATRDAKKNEADPSACSVWGKFTYDKKPAFLLLDCWEEYLGLPDLIRKVKGEMGVAYGDDQDVAMIQPMFGPRRPVTSGRKPDMLVIEDKGSGISLRQMLEREGIIAYAYNPGRADKLTRLHNVSHIFAQGFVWAVESAKFPGKPRTWAEPLIGQLCSYSGKDTIKHDDLMDTATQAIRLLADQNLLSVTAPKGTVAKDPDERPAQRIKTNPYAE